MRKKILSAIVALTLGIGMTAGSVFYTKTVAYAADEGEDYKIVIPEKYLYELSEEEQQILDEALKADGESAALLVNKIESQYGFEKVLETILDSYFEDDFNVSEKFEAFKANADSRANEIINDYIQVNEQRTGKVTITYVPDSILVNFDSNISDDEIINAINVISNGGEIVKSQLHEDRNLFVFVKLKKGQLAEKMVSVYSEIPGVVRAELDILYGMDIESDSLKLSESEVEIYKKQAVSVKAALNGKQTKDVTWSSSDTGIAKVNKNGKITGVAEGSAIITAVSKSDADVKAICKVTVKSYSKKVKSSKKTFVTNESFTFNNEFITSYSQMNKLLKKYKACKGSNKSVYKQLKKYDKDYFKKNAVCINSHDIYSYEKLTIKNVTREMKSNGKFTVNIALNVSGKQPDDGLTYGYEEKRVQCFVEIPKTIAKTADKTEYIIKS